MQASGSSKFLREMAATRTLSVKVVSMSVAVLLTAVMLKLSLPVLVDFVNYELPLLCSIAVSWLTPPYLYLVINCIILTIVASSKLQPQKAAPDGSAVAPQSVQTKAQEGGRFVIQSPFKRMFDLNDVPVRSPVVFGYVDAVAEEKVSEAKPATPEAVEGRSGEGEPEEERIDGCETETEEFDVSRSSWMPPRKTDPSEHYVSSDKPLVSQRFANRKSIKSSPEGGKARLGVSKLKRQDMLESTWRTITDGRPMPLKRHLKKSETLDTHGRGPQYDSSPSDSPVPVMKKAETFNDRTTSNNSSLSPSPCGGGSGRMKREQSLSHDELNRRVEAFIRKFNEEMRLQQRPPTANHRFKQTSCSRRAQKTGAP